MNWCSLVGARNIYRPVHKLSCLNPFHDPIGKPVCTECDNIAMDTIQAEILTDDLRRSILKEQATGDHTAVPQTVEEAGGQIAISGQNAGIM